MLKIDKTRIEEVVADHFNSLPKSKRKMENYCSATTVENAACHGNNVLEELEKLESICCSLVRQEFFLFVLLL